MSAQDIDAEAAPTEYDDEGNPIPKMEDIIPVKEVVPITEDMDIDHESQNRALATYTVREKPYVEGQEVLKLIKNGLSSVSMNHNKSYYSYKKLDLTSKKISTLYNCLENYPRIRILNLSDNLLKDISSIIHMRHLEDLNVSNNKIPDISILHDNGGNLTFLGKADFSKNKLTKMSRIDVPRLYRLNLDENQIDSCSDFGGHPVLEVLTLRKNKLTHLKGISNCAGLKTLYLNENQITTLKDLCHNPQLEKINMKLNPIEKLDDDISELPSLRQVNFKETQLSDKENLFKLLLYPKLANVNVSGSPLGEDAELKRDFLIKKRDLKKFNKEEITEEDREDAANEEKRRIEEEEEKLRVEEEERKAKEEEDRLKAEEGAEPEDDE